MSDEAPRDLLAEASRPDPERRFGGLRRLHGPEGYERLRGARKAWRLRYSPGAMPV